MCLHRLFEVFFSHHFQWTNLNHAGVVHQHVDIAKACVYGSDHVSYFLSVSDVTSNHHHFTAELLEVEPRAFELFFIARAKCETSAVSREFARHNEAEPSRASGDQDRFVSEVVFAQIVNRGLKQERATGDGAYFDQIVCIRHGALIDATRAPFVLSVYTENTNVHDVW